MSRLPPVSFTGTGVSRVSRVSRVCPGSPRCLFTGTVPGVFLPVQYEFLPACHPCDPGSFQHSG